jgi:hypothetical protein
MVSTLLPLPGVAARLEAAKIPAPPARSLLSFWKTSLHALQTGTGAGLPPGTATPRMAVHEQFAADLYQFP